MKNRIITSLIISISLIIFQNEVKSEDFIFESDFIEFKDNGNIIEAKNGVKIITKDNVRITANQSFYNKLNAKLLLKGNVVFENIEDQIKIFSQEINYKTDIEKITSKNKTTIHLANDYIIDGYGIEYFKEKKIVTSKNKVTLTDNFKNTVTSTSFKYLINKKLFEGINIIIVDKDMNNYFIERSMVNLNNNKILGKDIEINFAKNTFDNTDNDPRLRGSSITLDENETIIKNGIFTVCKKNDSCPPWSIKSSEIKHDKLKKTINYKDAWLQFYDTPVFYFPKFFHPDPTVKRQSGFLMPGIKSSQSNGSSVKVPYYKVFSENRDLTITPRFYFNNDIMIQNEFRQVEKTFENIIDFSIKKSDNYSKTHLFTNTKIDLDFIDFDQSNLEVNFEKTSNDTYLKTDSIVTQKNFNPSVLNSYVNYNINRDDLDVSLNFQVYEDLSKTKNSDKYEYIYPNFTISKIIPTSVDLFGSLTYQATGFQKKYDTNVFEKSFTNDFDFSSKPFFTKLGFINDVSLLVKNTNKEGKNSKNYNDKFIYDNYSYLILNSSYPLRKKTKYFDSQLKPRMSLRLSPSRSEILSSEDRRIDNVNIFSKNRLGLADSLEGGQSLTLGGEYNLEKKDGSEIIKMSLGQIYRDINEKNLPTKSKMTTKSSDIVGGIKISANDYLDIDYNFSLDNNLKTSNYSMLKSTISVNNFVTSFEFLEENNEIGAESYLLTEASYGISGNSTILFRERKNKKTNLKEFYNLIYQYKNDCLVAALEYNKDYYSDRDLKPKEELFFSITITPFASAQTSNFSK